VKLFNPILETKLSAKEKGDLLPFLHVLCSSSFKALLK